MSFIVVLQARIVWTVFPRVIVLEQAALVSIGWIWRRRFDLLLGGWLFFHLVRTMRFLDCLQDCLDCF